MIDELVKPVSGQFARRDPRFRVGEHSVRVVFEREEGFSPSELEARLLDLSTSGARLSLHSPVRFQEAATLRIESEAAGFRLAVPTSVCWIRSQDEGTWVLGCSFDPELPEDVLEEMFQHRLLDRRHDPRRPISGKGVAQWELTSEPVAVDLTDLSQGGFCLRSPAAAAPNSRLVLAVTRQDGTRCEVAARTQWQLKEQDGYLVGCQFVSSRGSVALCAALGVSIPCAQPPRVRARTGGLSLMTLVGVLAVVAWCCAFILVQ